MTSYYLHFSVEEQQIYKESPLSDQPEQAKVNVLTSFSCKLTHYSPIQLHKVV